MHIAFLTSEYPHVGCGGIGTSIRNHARALVALGHRVSVVGCGRRAEFDDGGVRVNFLEPRRVPKLTWLTERRALSRELRRMVRCEALDVVEAHDWCGPSAWVRADCPVVVRCNGSAVYFSHLTGEPVRPAIRALERAALRQADALVAVSRFAADVTRRVFGIDRPIEVIPNGIDLDRFRPADPSEVTGDTILYFGTLVRKKGVLDLARFFPEVLALAPQSRLVLVGRDTPDFQTGAPSTWGLIEAALPEAVRGRVDYLGPRPYDEVHEHVRRASVCVFPSYAEAFPVSWIEAMACAKAVVAYDVGWAPEAIEHGVSGFLVPPGDYAAMARAAASAVLDTGTARRVGAAAQERVAALFSSQVVARRLANYYKGVAASAAAPAASVTATDPGAGF